MSNKYHYYKLKQNKNENVISKNVVTIPIASFTAPPFMKCSKHLHIGLKVYSYDYRDEFYEEMQL